MLVLTRKTGQEIQIGGNVTITVLLTSRNRVKLGVSGPLKIRVRRGEMSGVGSHEETMPAVASSHVLHESCRRHTK